MAVNGNVSMKESDRCRRGKAATSGETPSVAIFLEDKTIHFSSVLSIIKGRIIHSWRPASSVHRRRAAVADPADLCRRAGLADRHATLRSDFRSRISDSWHVERDDFFTGTVFDCAPHPMLMFENRNWPRSLSAPSLIHANEDAI
jgi:hypothetical protein